MSTYVGKLFTAVSSALEFNTATLSGAIDIIVIEDDQGRRQSTPFHVRFGKLQLLKSRGISVDIELNGHRTNLRMLLGAAGEAYFYHQSSSPLSPLNQTAQSTPSTSADIGASAQSLTLPTQSEVQRVSTASSAVCPPSSTVNRSGHAITTATKTHGSDATHHHNSTQSRQPSSVTINDSTYAFAYISDSEVELTRAHRDGENEVVDEPRSPPLFPSQRMWAATLPHTSAPLTTQPPCTTLDDSLEDSNAALFGLPASPLKPDGTPSSDHPAPPDQVAMPAFESKYHAPEASGNQPDAPQVSGATEEEDGSHENRHDVTIRSTLNDIVGEEETKLDCRSIDGYDADDDNDVTDVLRSSVVRALSKTSAIAFQDRSDTDQSPREVLTQTPSINSEVLPVSKDGSHLGQILVMSRCGELIEPTMPEEEILDVFEKYQVSYEEFESNPNLLFDNNMLFRIDNRIVELRVAAPLLFSALAYGEKMDIDVLARKTAQKTAKEAPKSPPTPRRFRWFGWSSPPVVGEPLLGDDELIVLEEKGNGVGEGQAKVSSTSSELTSHSKESVGSREPATTSGPSGGVLSQSGVSTVPVGLGKEIKAQEQQNDSPDESPPLTELKLEEEFAIAEDGESGLAHEARYSSNGLVGTTVPFSDLDPEALSLLPTADQLKELSLEPGANSVRFIVASSNVELSCRIFLWSCNSKIVISDVDGTITRSDVLGHVLPAVGRDWSQVGVAGLYTQIEKNGYKMVYLTARPVGQASQTRAFLHNVIQGSAKLPNGPVLMSPNRLVESFTREVIRRKPHEFKIAALRELRCLFPPDYNPFHAGFGNRDTDVISYRAVGLIPQRIFVVNPKGELVVMKAKYESTASYSTLQDLVESVFPDISGQEGTRKIQALTENATFNDWNYWRRALPEVNFEEMDN